MNSTRAQRQANGNGRDKKGAAAAAAKGASTAQVSGPSAAKTAKSLADVLAKPRGRGGAGQDRASKDSPYHMSPHYPTNIPVALRCGQAFPYTGVIKLEITQAIGETILIAATNPGSAGTVALIGRQSGIAIPTYSVATIPTLSFDDETGGPTSTRAMKFGVSLTCNTPLLNRGSRIYHLNGQSRVRIDHSPQNPTLAVFQSVVQVITGMPSTVPYDNTHFAETREFTSNVVDNVSFIDFERFEGTLGIDEIASHMFVWPGLGGGLRDRPMSTIWLIFTPPAVAQNYSVGMHASYYSRWGLSTIQGQSQTDIPVAPLAVINSMLEHNDRMSTIAHTLLEVGQKVGSALVPYVTNRAEQYAAGQLALGV